MHKIFWVSLSAAVLAARLSGAAETTYDAELDRIEELVDRGNWVELRSFLRSRPDLVAGDDPFSRELQNFLGQTTGLYSALIIDQVKYPDVKNASRASKTDSLVSGVQNLGKPPQGDADLLLEAELAALKGLPSSETNDILITGEGEELDPKSPLRKAALLGLEEADQAVEMASLDIDHSNSGPARSVGAIASASSRDDDFSDDEPDAAVTSARDSGPAIY